MTQEESVAQKTARTSIWSAVEQVVNLGSKFVITMWLARLLSPSDYGVVAMLTVFITISTWVAECGFTNALICKNECTQKDYSTAFYFNIIVSFGLYALLFITAPWIASFYSMPLLRSVLRVYALTFVLNSFQLVHLSILRRKLNYKLLSIASSISFISAGIIAVILAYKGWGAWALVAQTLLATSFNVILLWCQNNWRPTLEWSDESFKYLWSFGSKMLVANIISSIYQNIYSLVIGKKYNSHSLGIFNRGESIATLLPNIVQNVFVRTSLPILSEIQNDSARLLSVYRKFIILVCFINFPLAALSIALAKPFVLFFLGGKWAESIIYIQIFAISTFTLPANYVNLNIFQVKGRTDISLKTELIRRCIGFATVFALVPFGTFVLAIGATTVMVLSFGINLWYTKKIMDFSIREQIKDIAPCLFAAILAGATSMMVIIIPIHSFWQLLIGGCAGIIVYFLITKWGLKMDVYYKIGAFFHSHIK